MGLFSSIKKAVKKIASPITKAVMKVTSKIVKVGKKIVKGIGRVAGKLGPLGMMAIGFIAPYAIGAMAGSSVGWVSTIGKTIQAAQAAVAAPFKALGQVAGAGAQKVGGMLAEGAAKMGMEGLSQGITSITENIVSTFGYKGDLTQGVKDIFSDVGQQFSNITKVAPTVEAGTAAQYSSTQTMSPVETATERAGLLSPDAGPSIGLQESLDPTGSLGVNTQSTSLASQIAADPYSLEAAQLSQLQDTMATDVMNPETGLRTSTKDRLKKVAKAGLDSLFDMPTAAAMPEAVSTPTPEAGSSSFWDTQGSQFGSFIGQDKTGLPTAEELMRNQYSLLNPVRG